METVLAIEPIRRLRGLLRCAGGDERDGPSRSDVRFHRGSRPCLGGGRKRGQEDQALGRSRGGFSTKIHLKVDLDGLRSPSISLAAKPATVAISKSLLDLGPDITPRAAIADKGYDAKANRDGAAAAASSGHSVQIKRRKQAGVTSRKSSTRHGPVSNRPSANSNGSSASRYAARRPHRNSRPSSHSPGLHLDQIRPHGLVVRPGVVWTDALYLLVDLRF